MKTIRRWTPGNITAANMRCVVCREVKRGPVACPLPGRSSRSRDCVCVSCAERAAEWLRLWRKHITAWRKDGTLDGVSPSAPLRKVAP